MMVGRAKMTLTTSSPGWAMGAKPSQGIQTCVALQSSKGVLEVQASNNMVRVLREPGSNGKSHGQTALGRINAKLSFLEEWL